MNSMKNKVQLIGNLGADPEVKNVGKNGKMVRLSLATSESYLNAKKEKTDEINWHNLLMWDNLAKSTEKFLHKGDTIAIEGRLKNNTFTDKNGEKRYANDIVVHEYQLLHRKVLEKA
jgi:single-strand DNA-binding protein